MGTNQFLPFGTDSAANVIDQASYTALSSRGAGFTAGTAQSAQVNKVWRQSSLMAAMIGQLIADYSGADAVDDGNISNLAKNYIVALKALLPNQLQANAITTVNVTGLLGKAVAGGTVVANSGSAIVLTLPAASSVALGAHIEFLNIGSAAVTIARGGSDVIVPNSSVITSIVLGSGDTLMLESDGVSRWLAVNGSACLPFSAIMKSAVSKTSSGYKSLPAFPGEPNPILLQWGTLNAVPTGGGAQVTFPVTFPNAYLSGGATFNQSGGISSAASGGIGFPTPAGMNVFNNGSVGATAVTWYAIGY